MLEEFGVYDYYFLSDAVVVFGAAFDILRMGFSA